MEFVNFKIAKKLKEKGFIGNGDIGCRCGFYTDADNYAYDDLDNSELLPNECLRFTISQALKWLREEKKIHVNIDIIKAYPAAKLIYWGYNIVLIDKYEVNHSEWNSNSFEQAALAGIEYVIDNLI
jgi:hypothetical protein